MELQKIITYPFIYDKDENKMMGILDIRLKYYPEKIYNNFELEYIKNQLQIAFNEAVKKINDNAVEISNNINFDTK